MCEDCVLHTCHLITQITGCVWGAPLSPLYQMLCMLVSRAGCDPHRLDFGAVGRLQESFLREAQAMYSNMKRCAGGGGDGWWCGCCGVRAMYDNVNRRSGRRR